MKKWVKVLLIVLAALILLTGAFTIWQRENLKALLLGMTKSEEELQTLVTETRSELADKLELDLAFIELEAKRLVRKPENEQTPQAEDDGKAVERILAKLYALESEFLGRIAGVEASTRSAYLALPPEQRAEKRMSLVSDAIGRVFSMENECDGKVNALIAELREALKKENKDPSIAEEVYRSYVSEKGLKKAEYLQKYKKYM